MSKTYVGQFAEALACETKDQADKWLAGEIERYRVEFGKEADEAARIISMNLGYMAGYYNTEVAHKINRLYGATHPIFGGSDYHDTVTPEEAFALGEKSVSTEG